MPGPRDGDSGLRLLSCLREFPPGVRLSAPTGRTLLAVRRRLTPLRQGAGRKLQPHRVSQPDECPHQAGFQRCGSGRRNGGGRIVSGSDRPSRATLSTPARAAAKVAVSPEVEIPGLPRPLRQGEINRRELPPIPSPLHPPYPAPPPHRLTSPPVPPTRR